MGLNGLKFDRLLENGARFLNLSCTQIVFSLIVTLHYLPSDQCVFGMCRRVLQPNVYSTENVTSFTYKGQESFVFHSIITRLS